MHHRVPGKQAKPRGIKQLHSLLLSSAPSVAAAIPIAVGCAAVPAFQLEKEGGAFLPTCCSWCWESRDQQEDALLKITAASTRSAGGWSGLSTGCPTSWGHEDVSAGTQKCQRYIRQVLSDCSPVLWAQPTTSCSGFRSHSWLQQMWQCFLASVNEVTASYLSPDLKTTWTPYHSLWLPKQSGRRTINTSSTLRFVTTLRMPFLPSFHESLKRNNGSRTTMLHTHEIMEMLRLQLW